MTAARPSLYVHAVAACGEGAGLLPAARVVTHGAAGPRRARLPGIAVAMTRTLLGDAAPDPRLHVLLGTALGCATETEQFLVNLVVEKEATPKPRAFSQSVHCAIASQVAIEFGARGEAQTFTHGEVSFGHALLAAHAVQRRAPNTTLLVGALDEGDSMITRHVCPTLRALAPENGALLLCRGQDGAIAELAWVAGGSRGLDGKVLAQQLRQLGADATWWVPPLGTEAMPSGLAAIATPVPTSLAANAMTTALAIAVVAGEVPPTPCGLTVRPRAIAVVAASRFGDWHAVLVRGCT